jgi:hypothetical protein
MPLNPLEIQQSPNEDAPLSWTLEAGGFLLHRVNNGGLTTHVLNGPAPLVTKYE